MWFLTTIITAAHTLIHSYTFYLFIVITALITVLSLALSLSLYKYKYECTHKIRETFITCIVIYRCHTICLHGVLIPPPPLLPLHIAFLMSIVIVALGSFIPSSSKTFAVLFSKMKMHFIKPCCCCYCFCFLLLSQHC